MRRIGTISLPITTSRHFLYSAMMSGSGSSSSFLFDRATRYAKASATPSGLSGKGGIRALIAAPPVLGLQHDAAARGSFAAGFVARRSHALSSETPPQLRAVLLARWYPQDGAGSCGGGRFGWSEI